MYNKVSLEQLEEGVIEDFSCSPEDFHKLALCVQNITLECNEMRLFQISYTNYILSKIIRFAISYLLNHALPLGMLIKGENTIISSLVFILLVVTVTHIDRFDIFCPTHVCRFSFLVTQWVVPEVYAWLTNQIKNIV